MTDPITQLLVETQLADDIRLRELLAEVRDTATSVRPLPSAEVAALLVPSRRRPSAARHRVLITTIVVVGTLAAGATAAAASPEVRSAAGRAIQSVVGTLLPEPAPVPGGTTASTDASRRPTPQNSSANHPGVTDHPSATDHPSGTDHPGQDDHPGNGVTPGAPSPGTEPGPHSTSGSTQPPKTSHGSGPEKQ